MNSSFLLLGMTLLALTTGALAENGPVTLVSLTNAPTSTLSPPQTNAPSAPGAQGPGGSNGINTSGKPMTKAPSTPPDPDATPTPPPPAAATPAAPATPAAKAAGSLLDKFISDLADAVKLSDDEKKSIQSYYAADAPTLQKVLNDTTLSPLQQDEQVADLRDKRDAKIDALLEDPTRQQEFYAVEADYRVALTDAAANGALIPAAPAPATTTPASPATPPPAAAPAAK
jgi:hypothetical protein